MKLFVHIALMLVFMTACPFEGNSQNLPAKVVKSIRPVPKVLPPISKKIYPGSVMIPPSNTDKTKGYSQRIKDMPVTPPIIKNVPTVTLPICKIDSTVFEDANNIHRMHLILNRSTERVDSTRGEWLSLRSAKDPSFAYEEYKFEKSRLRMLKSIAMTPEVLKNTREALMRMEAIYNREVIVLPNVVIDIPVDLK